MSKNDSIPSGWIQKTIGSIYEVVGGGTPSTAKQEYWEGNIPWITSADINGVRDINISRHITDKAIENSATNKVPPQTLLVVTRVGLGKISISQSDICFSQDLQGLIASPELINPEYALYYLSFALQTLKYEGRGTTISGITKKQLKDTNLPIPPYNEQNRIVAKIEELFSELDKGIESLKTAREQLKIYRQAVLKHAFEGKLTESWREENKDKLETADELLERINQERESAYQQQLEDWKAAIRTWEENGKEGKKPSKPANHKALLLIEDKEIDLLPDLPVEWFYIRLAEIARVGSGMSVSKDRKLENPTEVSYLRVANVQRGELVLDEIKTMLIEKDKLKDLALQKWDVLFNEGGDRDKLGRGWIWEDQVNPCITQNHVFRATTYIGGEFHAKFISHWGNTFGQDYFDKGGKQTTNLASINKTVLSMFPVPFPPLEEQKIIIEKIDDIMSFIDSIEQEIENGIEKSETLRQSILKQAFSGKLVAQDQNDEPASVLLERIKAEKDGTKNKKRNAA